MKITDKFIRSLPSEICSRVLSISNPLDLQVMLDEIPYRPEDENYCALSVFRDGRAHCFDGGLLAAAVLTILGYEPRLVQMIPHNDDDHILVVYKKDGYLGAVAKSNFVNLRLRSPVYRSIRELIMTYFDVFYNVDGEFTMQGYSSPLNLSKYNKWDWLCSDEGARKVAQTLHDLPHTIVMTPDQLKQLGKIDSLTYKAGLMISNPAGLYKTKK